MRSAYHLEEEEHERPSTSHALQRRASETVIAVQKLLTSKTLNEVFSLQYRRRSAIAFIVYLLLGIGYYCGHEKFTVLDSVYFSVTTILTIGYGDKTPNSPYQRYFTCFYILLGLLIISAVIGSITEILYEIHNDRVDKRVQRAAVRMKNVKENPNYHKVLEFLDVSDKARSSSSSHTDPRQDRSDSVFSSRVRQSIDTFSSAFSNEPSPEEVAVEHRMLDAMQKLNMEMFDEELTDIEHRAKWDFIIVCGVILLGCLIMLGIEKWYFGESLYWAIVTITTVGFGDVVPKTDSGKAFTIIYCVIGCALLARGLNDLIKYPLLVKAKQTELKVMMQFGGHLSEDTLRQILENDFFERIPNLRQQQHAISKAEFVLMVLGMMNKVHDKDIIIVSKVFEMLDSKKEGTLSASHIAEEIAKAQEREEQKRLLEARTSTALPPEDRKKPMSELLHVRGLENMTSRMKRGDGRGRAERLPDDSAHGDEAYNPMLPGQTSQALQKPLIPSEEPSSHGPSEHGAVRGTYILSLPEDVEAGRSERDGEGGSGTATDDDAHY